MSSGALNTHNGDMRMGSVVIDMDYERRTSWRRSCKP